MKNKIKSLVAAVSVAVLTGPVAAFAQIAPPAGTGLPDAPVMTIVEKFMNWLLIMVGILGVIGFAIAGILYLTAAGDEERSKSAKRAMIYSIVGVVVALLGLVVIRFALSFLGGGSKY